MLIQALPPLRVDAFGKRMDRRFIVDNEFALIELIDPDGDLLAKFVATRRVDAVTLGQEFERFTDDVIDRGVTAALDLFPDDPLEFGASPIIVSAFRSESQGVGLVGQLLMISRTVCPAGIIGRTCSW